MAYPEPADFRRLCDEAGVPRVHPPLSELASLPSHLLICRPCREALVRRHRVRRRMRAGALAASLLLAVGLSWTLAPGRPEAPAPTGAVPPPTGRETPLGRSILLTEGPGSVLSRGPDGWVLERGSLLAETAGEPFSFRAQGLEVVLEDGALAFEILSSGAGLMRSAEAAEPRARIRLIRGKARLGSREASGPSAWAWDGTTLSSAPASQGPSFWIPLEPGRGPIRESTRVLLPSTPPSGYVLEVLLRKRDASAEAGLAFEAGGKGWEVSLGSNLLAADEGWKRLRLTAGPAGCRASLGSRELLSESLSSLAWKASPEPASGAGIRAWGGAVEVLEARWRPLP